jgi:hypothetical protein
MRTRTRTRAFAVLGGAALVLLAGAGPAAAKGPSSGEISGPGIDEPIVLEPEPESDGAMLGDELGFFAAAFQQQPDPMLADAPTDDLGPKLTITWTVPDGEGTPATITQDLYLYAAGGPLTFTPEQSLWPGQDVQGGWFRAPDDVVATLVGLGVPGRADLEQAAPPDDIEARAAAATRSDTGSGDPWPLLPVAGGILAVVTIAGGGLLAGRRRSAHAQATT